MFPECSEQAKITLFSRLSKSSMIYATLCKTQLSRSLFESATLRWSLSKLKLAVSLNVVLP